MSHNYVSYKQFNAYDVAFHLDNGRDGKVQIKMAYTDGDVVRDAAFVSPPCVTNWPRVNGDGNFGTMWGPSDVTKAKFTLDLTDAAINGVQNQYFNDLEAIMAHIDGKLLDFVQNNQMKILGRKNLTRDEVKMLQIPSVRAKHDRNTGALTGHSLQLSTAKYAWDGMGGKYARDINICDMDGKVVKDGAVTPGDVVAATIYCQQVYNGVGGDKFGINWAFEDVQILCQRTQCAQKVEVPSFLIESYDFAQPYVNTAAAHDAQFSEPTQMCF